MGQVNTLRLTPERRIELESGFKNGLSYFENFSFEIHKETFVILDNASVHKAKIIRERMPH